MEIGVRPEFVSFADHDIAVDIVRVSDAGRYLIVEVCHGEHLVKVLVPEGQELPSENTHIHFDPSHTQVYADGWMVN